MKRAMARCFKQPTKFYKKDSEKMRWILFDAKGKILGRLASEIAKVLRGKHTPEFTPNADVGDGVIVINAKDIKVTGSKAAQKIYYTHSGHMGGLKEIPYKRMLERHPERVLEHAVKGMIPKTKLGRAMCKKLRIYADAEHNMQAQQPIQANI